MAASKSWTSPIAGFSAQCRTGKLASRSLFQQFDKDAVRVHSRPDYHRTIELPHSWRTHALNAVLRLTLRKRITGVSDVVALRGKYEQIDARYFQVARDVTRTPVACGGVAAEWITVPESRAERVILYLHGGSFAFRFPNAHAALVSRLCRHLGARALIPDYRLAPEDPFPAAPDGTMRQARER